MANRQLFKTIAGRLLPKTNRVNEAGGVAYELPAEHALAQYAATGCFSQTFYASAAEQLDRVTELAMKVDVAYLAKVAVFAREKAYMKDTPALLAAVLSVRDVAMLERVFDRVVDNGKMLRNFVQILRSGVVGRKSLGSAPKRLVKNWLCSRTDEQVFRSSVGTHPSMADIVKMTHPRPVTDSRRALYAWMIGRDYDSSQLPELVRSFEAFKNDQSRALPDVPFEMLTSLPLTAEHWKQIASRAPWHMTRMNLNTFARQGVFMGSDGSQLATEIADRLSSSAEIPKARVFPYQLLVAYAMADAEVPAQIREALVEAMEIAIENVPSVEKRVVVCPDVSGSMSAPVTGHRKGANSAVRCIDVAALMGAAMLRRNPTAEVIPFEHRIVKMRQSRENSVMTAAAKLASIGGGGTNCSAPLAELNARKAEADLVVFVSDNESWVDARNGRGTAMMAEWETFKHRNPRAKLVCIDIQPYAHSQVIEREDILNVGGFSDYVFELMNLFVNDELSSGHWVGKVEDIEL